MLLPEPVTPAKSTMPWSNLHSSSIDRRQIQPGEVGNPVVYAAGDQADMPKLLEHVDAESPLGAFDVDDVGEVGAAGFVEESLPALVEHREASAGPSPLLRSAGG